MSGVTLKDLVRAPLDAIYTAIDEKVIDSRAKLSKYMSFKPDGDGHLVIEQRTATIRTKNKWGEFNDIETPLCLFDNIVSLAPQDVVVDMMVQIDGFRKTSSGEIITNASVTSGSADTSTIPKGRMSFNIRYKNEKPPGHQQLQAIFLRNFVDEYQMVADNRDVSASNDVEIRRVYEKDQFKFIQQINAVPIDATAETIKALFDSMKKMQPTDPVKHSKFLKRLLRDVISSQMKFSLAVLDAETGNYTPTCGSVGSVEFVVFIPSAADTVDIPRLLPSIEDDSSSVPGRYYRFLSQQSSESVGSVANPE